MLIRSKRCEGKLMCYVECDCNSSEHAMKFVFFEHPDDFPTAYITHFIDNRGGFFRRLWRGVKYIFGHKSIYGDFGETLITIDTAKDIREFCDAFINYGTGKGA